MDKNYVKIILKNNVDTFINSNLVSLINNYDLAKLLFNELKSSNLDECKTYQIILNNIKLISNIISRYLSKQISIDDFIKCDNLGMICLVFKCNYQENYHNLSYITNWIRNSLIKVIAYKG